MNLTTLMMRKQLHLAYLIFYSVIVLAGCQAAEDTSGKESVTQKVSIVPAITHRFADLPDSLQPKEIFMADRGSPIEIPVPIKKGSFSFITSSGIPIVLPQEPPLTSSLPLLTNHNGDTVLTTDGKPMLLGNGGKAFFKHFSTDDGLALDGVLSSLLDSKGNYWIGTQGAGLSRFDGQKFTNFNTSHGLTGSLIYCLMEDSRGYIWIGTDNGLNRYDGKSFKNYNEHEELKKIVFDVKEDNDGSLWIATLYNGLIHLDMHLQQGAGQVLAKYDTTNGLRHQAVSTLFKDDAGKIWIGNGPGISRFDGQKFIHFTIPDNQGLLITQRMAKDRSGNFWIGTSKGLYYFNPEGAGTLLPFSNDTRLSEKWIRAVHVASDGKVWIGTAEDGLHVFDGKQFTSFTTANGLTDDAIISIQEDKDGHIWMGTTGAGIGVFKDPSFSNLTNQQGLTYLVWGILEAPDDNFWLATYGGGIAKLKGQTITYYGEKQGMLNGNLSDVEMDNIGNLWITSRSGLSIFDGKVFRTYNSRRHGLPSSAIYCITPAATGGYWAGTSQGLSRVILEKNKTNIFSLTNYTTKQGLSDATIKVVKESKNGKLWIGTEKGLNYFDGSSFRVFNKEHGLPDEYISTISLDAHGNIWIGTNNGLAFADSAQVADFITNARPGMRFRSYSISDGLPDNTIMILLELPGGKMVAGTNQGLAIFNLPDGKDNSFEKLHDLEIFNATTGYPVRDVNAGGKALTLDSKGVLWIATGSDRTNLVKFDYRAVTRNKKPATVNIQRLQIDEVPVSWSTLSVKNNPNSGANTSENFLLVDETSAFGRSLGAKDRDSLRQRFDGIRFDSILPFSFLPQNLELPYRHNQVSFEFGSNELANPGMVEYQYLLEGYNRDWSPPLKQTKATFGNISEGKYAFRVKARYTGVGEPGANNWSEEARFNFKVLPPWYRSWWAYAFYVLVLGLVIWRIHKYQKMRTIRKVRETAQEKELAQAKEIEKAYANLKMTQQQLIQSEKMASLGELTAGIAHEIQNPLNFVNNFSEVSTELVDEMNEELSKGNIQDAQQIADDLKQNLEKINHHGKRAGDIVKGMLQHSRSSSGQKEPTDINALCDEYLRLAYHGLRAKDKSFNASFETNFDPHLPKVNVVPQDIGRVLLNLLNNAFQAVQEEDRRRQMADSGQQTADTYKPLVTVTTKSLVDEIEIRIADNGGGIPSDIRKKIFQPFFTTKVTGKGTGLGLSIAYDIVKAHGGTINLESKNGEKTVFLIILPTN